MSRPRKSAQQRSDTVKAVVTRGNEPLRPASLIPCVVASSYVVPSRRQFSRLVFFRHLRVAASPPFFSCDGVFQLQYLSPRWCPCSVASSPLRTRFHFLRYAATERETSFLADAVFIRKSFTERNKRKGITRARHTNDFRGWFRSISKSEKFHKVPSQQHSSSSFRDS